LLENARGISHNNHANTYKSNHQTYIPNTTMTISFATDADHPTVREMFLEYQQYLGIDLCFQDFDNELKNLDKIYGQPQGCILFMKTAENNVMGCVALKPIAEKTCEMKRLYVRSTYRGMGIGRSLVQKLIQFAYQAGYDTMKLDTLTSLQEAIGLYQSFGFVETQPYVYNPLDNVRYFELSLRNQPSE
jgi:putative acetyltransferase